jgi:DNA-binding transcriptional ArsR family regulator
MVSRDSGAAPAGPAAVDVFAALADRSRREIVRMLAAREMCVKAIADNFDVTRPAVAKHLGVLERARLVRTRRQGRERLYRLDAAPLRAVRDWLAPYERFWSTRLRKLKADVERR